MSRVREPHRGGRGQNSPSIFMIHPYEAPKCNIRCMDSLLLRMTKHDLARQRHRRSAELCEIATWIPPANGSVSSHQISEQRISTTPHRPRVWKIRAARLAHEATLSRCSVELTPMGTSRGEADAMWPSISPNGPPKHLLSRGGPWAPLGTPTYLPH
jgi:hypothetical protein